mmetsp:Transcript_34454/g.42514  ORF Transcript_34454/g.42514 Transcript_34454/m.42514 type:complete len:98 (-) Transcript_34454:58-351(-)
MLIVMLSYGSVKLIQLNDKANPVIAENTEVMLFDSSEHLNLYEIGFRFAFSIEGYLDQERKDDPRYVRTIVQLLTIIEGKNYFKRIPHHLCTEADWA